MGAHESRGLLRKKETCSSFRVRGLEGKFVYLGRETEKCQIPTLTFKSTNGYTDSKISKVTDGSGRKKIFLPNLLSPRKMLKDLDADSMVNLTNFTLSFIFGISLKVNYKQRTNHAADVHITNKLSS